MLVCLKCAFLVHNFKIMRYDASTYLVDEMKKTSSNTIASLKCIKIKRGVVSLQIPAKYLQHLASLAGDPQMAYVGILATSINC